MTYPYVDMGDQAGWIGERCGLDLESIAAVLVIEMEYMAGRGISIPPVGYEFRYLDPAEIPEGNSVDTCLVAGLAADVLGVSLADADEVLALEIEYVAMQGLA